VNRCLIAPYRQTDTGGTYLLSAEGLTTLEPIELTQDLASVATLGVTHVERDGHHYYRGLDPFPEAMVEETLAVHGDPYCRHKAGFATLALDSVVDAPFGRAIDVDSGPFTPLAEWDVGDLDERE
jgi:hypothetical protein